jgi:hypothetical protein
MKIYSSFLFMTLLFANVSAQTTKNELTEEQIINHLIEYVKNLKGAVFIRNGSEYTAKEAAEHLQLKRKKAGSSIKTASEFILNCASKSSVSGKDYLIKLSDGKTFRAAHLLSIEAERFTKSKK